MGGHYRRLERDVAARNQRALQTALALAMHFNLQSEARDGPHPKLVISLHMQRCQAGHVPLNANVTKTMEQQGGKLG